MLNFWYKDGRYQPVFVCDVCHKRIEDADRAIAVNKEPNVSEEKNDMVLETFIVHRGNCDQLLQQRVGTTGCSDLDFFLYCLIRNVGLDSDKLRENLDRFNSLNSLG